MIKGLDLSVPLRQHPGRGERLESESIASVHQSCRCNEASIKIQRMGFGELLGWGARGSLGRVVGLGRKLSPRTFYNKQVIY